MPTEDADRLEAFNAISLAFIVEMAVKLAALDVKGYWTDGWNALVTSYSLTLKWF